MRVQQIIRDGHFRTLDYMDTSEFSKIKEIFESYPIIGGVYFRPTDKGVTVVDLHPESLKPRIGVGKVLTRYTTSQQIIDTIDERICELESKRARQKRASQENKFEAYLIQESQKNKLVIPSFPDSLRFIHSQWRIQSPKFSKQLFTDLVAVDISNKSLAIIELKKGKSNLAENQVSEYLDYFSQNAEILNPFFLRLARIMGKLYNSKELCYLDQLMNKPMAYVAWPDDSGKIEVRKI